MKKILYILIAKFIFILIFINIISCSNKNKLNIPNIKNIIDKPINSEFITQIPPKNSNWKLINISNEEELQKKINIKNNKWYIVIGKNKRSNDDNSIFLFNSKWNVLTINNNISFGNDNYFSFKNIKSIYYWNSNKKPKIIIDIDKNTGKIINWNKKNNFIN